MSDAGMEDGALAWCVIANVVAETAHGEGGQDIRPVLKHFSTHSGRSSVISAAPPARTIT
jgi:hypothetical protein